MPLEEFFILPCVHPLANPSWFGFPLTVRSGAPFTREMVIRYLEDRKIATRLLFAGNLTKQPAYNHVRYRVVGELTDTDVVMKQTFWLGVYPGLSRTMIEYVGESLQSFVKRHATLTFPAPSAP
jgi:CDP-6-deoxy-D-xylo-4-hexulose-3-dehydrase